MCNRLTLRLERRASTAIVRERGLTFESATDTLSQHRANFSAEPFARRKC